MRVAVAEEFARERQRFDFRFCCEDCVHFDPPGEQCVHGWPATDHRRARYEAQQGQRDVVFCKEFELR